MSYVYCYIRPRLLDKQYAETRAVVIAVRDKVDASELAYQVRDRFIGFKVGNEEAPMEQFEA